MGRFRGNVPVPTEGVGRFGGNVPTVPIQQYATQKNQIYFLKRADECLNLKDYVWVHHVGAVTRNERQRIMRIFLQTGRTHLQIGVAIRLIKGPIRWPILMMDARKPRCVALTAMMDVGLLVACMMRIHTIDR